MTSKYWCFTWNNPLTKTLVLPGGATYLVYQVEKGASGTPHLQGYIEWKSQKNLAGARKWLPEAHWEVRKGTSQQAADYCRKTEGRQEGPWEFGAMSVSDQGKRTDLVEFTAAIRDGASDSDLLGAYPHLFYKHGKMLEKVRMAFPPKARERKVILCVGPSGTGKTTFARSLGTQGEDLVVVPVTKDMWFDGCQGKRVVVLDDFKGGYRLEHLLRLLHPFPEMVAIKGGFALWNPEIVVITSNFMPEAWYDWEGRAEHLTALGRRFTALYWFGGAGAFACLPPPVGCTARWALWDPQPVAPAPVLPVAGSSKAEAILVAGAKRQRLEKRRPYRLDSAGRPVRTHAPTEEELVLLMSGSDSD